MVAAKSPPIKSPPAVTNLKTAKSPKSPRSPRSPRSTKPIESYTPLSSIFTEEPISTDNQAISPMPKGLALRRVLSGESSSSTIPSASITTPKNGNSSIPLSPNSGGIRTPKAMQTPLNTNNMDVDTSENDIGSNGGDVVNPIEGSGHQLANHLDGLQVNSPITGNPVGNGDITGFGQPSALGITQVLGHQTHPQPQPYQHPTHESSSAPSGSTSQQQQTTNYMPINGRSTAHDRSYSTSTEGSTTSAHPQIPSNLGSSYGPEGFPIRYSRSPENSPNVFNSSQQSIGNGYHASLNAGFGGADSYGKGIDPELALRQAEALAKADEAVRALNGTASLYQQSNLNNNNGTSTPMFEPYRTQFGSTGSGIPAMANFVVPHQPNVVRQSSTSSSTTDAASTSSEESDWCIPTIEWVSTNPQSPRFLQGYPNSPGGAIKGSSAQKDRNPSGKMPPPPTTNNKPSSPQNQGISANQRPTSNLQHQQSLPIGASAHTPSGIKQSSALPLGLPPNDVPDDDDDEATVGHNRERSPSTSSQSAQSGLDLLWRAAASHNGGAPNTNANADKPHLPVYEHAVSFDHKGKRKAGAEAVDKWRSSGIPTGVPPSTHIPTLNQPLPPKLSNNQDISGQPPRKRRRSEMTLESMEPPSHTKDGSVKRELSEEAIIEQEQDEAEGGDEGGDESEFKSPSASSEPASDADDSEYGVNQQHKRGRQPLNATKGGRNIAGTKRATASSTKNSAGGKASGINPANAPGGVTKGGTIKKVRKVGDSPPGGNRGGRRTSGGNAGGTPVGGGVQCEYINPLPPYNRCTDVFTRKYDLPRHMARHARREGELVLDGKLSEEKAVLWRTIKDKPKVTCNECGENFTRMDALKRHQAKQHHR
ncbi:uncharacterized protein L201_007852 [Kwoniella dendrophila CBS 6074]|uniref:C2H2-type domain-containing protein n=1 Tax=Kwoniella dendrophila CBS 6074 TaxID=1295534 RepID=A0AAX4K5N7_9TREE